MVEKTSPNNIQELKERALFLIQCLYELGLSKGDDKIFLDDFLENYKIVIEDAYLKKNIKGLNLLIKDTETWILHLSFKEIEQLNKKVFEKFGKYISEDTFLKKANSIVRKGKIKTKKEYEFLMDILELYSGSIERKELIDAVANIVASYEMEVRKTR